MKLSIIIPVYNVEKYLRECLDSLLCQTFGDWEAICVDDGSTDGSGRILDAYAARDGRIRVVHQKNARVHAARNRALEEARGDWIGFVDPDDAIARVWLETAVAHMTGDIDYVRLTSTGGREVSADFYAQDSAGARVSCVAQDGVPRWCWENLPCNGFLWLGFLRRERIGALRFRPDINCKEDGVFLLEMIPRLRGVCQVDYPGYFYRVVPGSLSLRRHYVVQTTAFIAAYREIWLAQRDFADLYGIATLVRRALTNGVINDICDWTLKRKGDDPHSEASIRAELAAFEAVGAYDETCRCRRRRYRIPYALWRRTGWVAPMTWVGCGFLAIGTVLRRLGLRKGL